MPPRSLVTTIVRIENPFNGCATGYLCQRVWAALFPDPKRYCDCIYHGFGSSFRSRPLRLRRVLVGSVGGSLPKIAASTKAATTAPPHQPNAIGSAHD